MGRKWPVSQKVGAVRPLQSEGFLVGADVGLVQLGLYQLGLDQLGLDQLGLDQVGAVIEGLVDAVANRVGA